MDEIDISIYSDYICPFSRIGNGLVERLRDETDVALRVTFLGMEIHPGLPPEGFPFREWFGEQDTDGMFEALNERGRALDLHFEVPERLPNSHKALLLSEYARDEGCFDPVHNRLFEAYFAEGQDIGDENVLRQIAAEVGLHPDEAWSAITDGRYEERLKQSKAQADAAEITSTPTFVLGESSKVEGAQPLEVLKDAVSRAVSEGQLPSMR